MWDGAQFSLKPIETAEDGSFLKVQSHWMHFSPAQQQIVQDFDGEED